MKKIFFLLIALFFSGLTYGQYLSESFDGSTFPPTGWTASTITNTNTLPLTGLWERVTTGTDPVCTTHSGAGMLKYNAWDYVAGTSAVIISPVIDLTSITATTVLEFWMYRDNGNLTTIDSLSFYINTSSSITAATLLGNYNRIKSKAPIETGIDGWYKYQVLIPSTFNTATNYLILKGHSAYGNNMFIDDIRILNPVAANAAPTNITFTGTTISGTTIGWTDNSTNEYSFSLYKSTNATSGFVLVDPYIASTSTATTGTTYSKTISGLSETTQYYFRISANAGLESPYLTGSTTTPTGTLSGVKTIGPTGTYPSLTAAFADITLNGLSASVDLILQPNYVSTVETFPITPSSSATALKKIRIYPAASGLNITSSNALGTINFDGASYVTIDGRVNATGNLKDLVIANTVTTASAIKFINDATHNIIKFCTAQGVDSTGIGVVSFSTTTGLNGNSYNLIDSCDIRDGASTPLNSIYSLGTSGADNKFNTISNCNIYNFYRSYACNPIGIGLGAGNNAWSILNNSFYQTSVRNPTAANGFNIIIISSGENHNISGNFIGGSAPLCGGTPFTINGLALANFIYAIRITSATSATSINNIQGNTIANISLQAYCTASGTRFAGVLSSAGIANIGTITGNVLGSNSTTGSIVYTSGNSTGTFSTSLMGLYISGGSGIIQNNVVGGITINASTASTATVSFYGIYAQGSGTNLISNNIVGNNTVSNSIQTIAATATPVAIAGIYTNITTTGSSITYANNTIANIVNNNTAAAGYLLGLRNAGTVTSVVDNNVIHDLSCAALNTGTTNLAAIVGISSSNSANNIIISRNSLYNFFSTAPSAATGINGIYKSGAGTNCKVERNLIYNFSINSSTTTSSINGIMTNGGTGIYSNNMIRLGLKPDGSDLTTGLRMNGIYDLATTNNFYFNTVYLGGNSVVSVDSTYAFRSLVTTTARNFKNNIFINARSNASGAGVNYAVNVAGTTADPAGLAMDYNIIQASGTGGIFGRFNLLDVADLASWKTNVGQDTNSLSINPLFAAPTAIIPNLHLTVGSPAESAGILIDSVSYDFDGDIRANNSPTDIGADAGYYDITLPTASFVPANLSTAVALNSSIEVTFNEMVRKIDNTVLDNSNIASVISFKKVSDNSNIAFSATWNSSTRKIVVTPTVALLGLTTYKLNVNVEDYNNNVLSGSDSTRFTTIVNTDATLSDLKVSGTTVTGFAPATIIYNVILASGTTVVPTVLATTTDINATKIITAAASLPGTTTVVVTAQDGTTTKTYTINFTVAPNSDASLSDLKVNGTTVTGFAATTLIYNVVLPFGTVVVPTVTATTTDANATKTITPAAALPGSTSVYTTAGDGTTHLTYTINFTIGAASSVATLSDLKVNGTTVTGFTASTLVYNVILPYGTTVVPTVTATTTDANATKIITPAATLPGSTTVVTTAQNGTAHLTYTVNFTIAPNVVATLSDLKVNGVTVTGFSASILSYTVTLPYGTTVVPTVTATTTDANATKVITPAATLPGTTNVVVTAQDGITTKTYTVNFTITAPSTIATLVDLKVDGTTVTGFSPTVLTYNVVLPAGTTIVPTVTASTASANATKIINPASSLPGATTVVVTAQDGTTTKTYTINFTVAIQTYSVTFNVVNGNGTLTATVDANTITSPATVNAGKNVIFTAVPAAGYEVKEWKHNGSVIASNTSTLDTLINLSANSTVTVEFKVIVGINEVNENPVNIYPVPAKDIINIKMNTDIHQISIISINGQLLSNTLINNKEAKINTSELCNGFYFLSIETSNGKTIKKIQISR
ncbi:MAG: beta strand repeat-containing protein [Bacteroidales bacterium]